MMMLSGKLKSATAITLAQKTAIILLVGAVLVVQLGTSQVYGQQATRTQSGATKQPLQQKDAGTNLNGASDRQQATGAPFFSIKDGKTSARRIQQQQVSPAQLGGGVRLAMAQQQEKQTNNMDGGSFSTTPEPIGSSSSSSLRAGVNSINVDEQPSAATLGGAGGGDTQSLSRNENFSQQRMMFGSFNQLVGNNNNDNSNMVNMDEFPSSTAAPSQQQQPMSENELMAGGGSLVNSDQQQPQQQRQQLGVDTFTTTGASVTSTGASAGSGTESPEVQPTGGAKQQQGAQFTMATGVPLSSSTPSSLSMNLDGMIMNSRPRSETTLGNKRKTTNTAIGIKTTQAARPTNQPINDSASNPRPQPRTGEFALNLADMARGLDAEMRDNANANSNSNTNTNANTVAFAKASRRVPFSGMPFSSPATKGLRTKPKASNQVGLVPEQQQQQAIVMSQMLSPRVTDQMLPALPQQQQQQQPMMGRQQQAANGQFSDRDMRQMIMDTNSGTMMQQQMQMPPGFDDEQQQRLSMQQINGLEGSSDAANGQQQAELMKNLVANSIGATMRTASATATANSGVGNGGMVMSVMSSADGNRRLVMMARDAFDSLQRFAVQQQQQAKTGIKGKNSGVNGGVSQQSGLSINRPTQQQQQQLNGAAAPASSLVTGSANSWWPNGQMMWMTSGTAGQQQQNAAPARTTTMSSIAMRDSASSSISISQLDQQQQEVQVQTTTSAPLIMFGSVNGITTTSASATTVASMATTTQQPAIGQQQTTTTTSTTMTQLPDLSSQVSAGAQSTAANMSNAAMDSFREVLVSTLVENEEAEQSVGDSSTASSQGPAATSSSPASASISGTGAGTGRQQQATSGAVNGGLKTKAKTGTNVGKATTGPKQAANRNGRSGGGNRAKSNSASSSSSFSKGNGKTKSNGTTSVPSVSFNSSQILSQGTGNGGKQQKAASNGKTSSGSKSTNGKKLTVASNTNGTSNKSKTSNGVSGATVRVTNGQQQPAAMMSRAFEMQMQKQQQSGTMNSESKINATFSYESIGMTTVAPQQQQSVGGASEMVDQLAMLGGQAASMTTASSIGSKRPAQSQQKTSTPMTSGAMAMMKNFEGDNETNSEEQSGNIMSIGSGSSMAAAADSTPATMGGASSPTSSAGAGAAATVMGAGMTASGFNAGGRGASSASSRLMPTPNFDANLERQLDELERSRGSSSSSRDDDEEGSMQGQNSLDGLDGLRAGIPGEPKLDYPIYSAPPKTSFDCMAQSCPAGYYADLETQCQVFHICQNDGRFDTFLCPNGTIFSQQHFVCVWWWQVDCQQSTAFYKLNDGIYCNSMFPNTISSSSISAGSSASSTLTAGDQSSGTRRQSTSSTVSRGFSGDAKNATRTNKLDGSMSDEQAGMGSVGGDSGPTFSSMMLGSMLSDNVGATGGASTISSLSPSGAAGSESGGRSASSGNANNNRVTGAPSEASVQGTGSSESATGGMRQQAMVMAGGNAVTGTADADLNQQQQQQLELLSKRA